MPGGCGLTLWLANQNSVHWESDIWANILKREGIKTCGYPRKKNSKKETASAKALL